MLKIFITFVFAFMLLASCTAPAAVAPTILPTVPPAAPTVTVRANNTAAPTRLPTTDTAVPTTAAADTVTPTNTVEATDVQAPTPTAAIQVNRDRLVGTWWQFDNAAQGNNYIIFRDDGTFGARHGPNPQAGIPVSEGTFRLEADQLTITDNTDCPEGEMYQIRFTTGDHLFFRVLGSTCDNFADDFKRQPNWDRLPPAP